MTRRRAPLISCLTVSALAAGLLASIAGANLRDTRAQPRTQIDVSPARTNAGRRVMIVGRGWKPSGVRCSRVVVVAFAWGVSPWSTKQVGAVSVGTDGRFTRRWVTPRVGIAYPWGVQATQRCGANLTRAFATVTLTL